MIKHKSKKNPSLQRLVLWSPWEFQFQVELILRYMVDKNINKSKDSIATKALRRFKAMKEKKARKKKTISSNKLARLELNNFHNSLEGMTKEEKIAANKARIAQYHPEPDLSTTSKTIYQSRKKMEFEKKMKEKGKKLWYSIVSVPMGGMKKR